MSAEDLAVAQQEPSGSIAGVLSDDELLDALNRERAARQRAEQLSAERDEAVARLQIELRDLGRLRDNFHSLYREERELRSEADRIAEERSNERDALQQQVLLLQSDVDRLDRMVTRYQAQRGGQTAAAEAAPAPVAPASRQADPAGGARVHELEREMGVLRAHAAELESQLAALRATHQAVQSGRTEHADELAAALRRVHDLDGELATLRAEHADLRAAYERLTTARDTVKQSLAAEAGQREEAQRFAASAEQRVQEAVSREQEAVREANQQRTAAERAEQDLQAARATIAVLEKRIHDAEAARSTAEQRSTELAEELSFVRSDVLTERPAPARRTLLRRRPGENGSGRHAAAGHVETVGTAIGVEKAVEVSGTPEDVETALHRRLFGGE